MLVKSNIIAYKEAVELMQKTKKGGNRNDSIFRKHLFRVLFSFILFSIFQVFLRLSSNICPSVSEECVLHLTD